MLEYKRQYKLRFAKDYIGESIYSVYKLVINSYN